MKRHQEVIDENLIKFFSKVLNIPESRTSGMLKRRILQKVSRFFPDHYRFDKGVAGFEAGTAVFIIDDSAEIVRGFPKIQRAMVLDPTLKKHFVGLPTAVIEEKMNGYNVRIVNVRDRIIALTRGGLMCPYTTEKVTDEIGYEFFHDHPELVLCGEMVGPDNPYVPKDIYPDVESVSFYIFDIREKNSGKPLTISEKYELCARYNIRSVRNFGEHPVQSLAKTATDIIKELGKAGREGVVIKDPGMKRPPLKYTCSQSNNSDLRYAFQFYNDYGRDFFFSRVVREGFQSVEWDEDEDALHKRCCQLGESILKPMVETIRKRKQGERITEVVKIRVRSLKTADQFEEHVKRMGIHALFEKPQYVDGQYLIKIKKLNKSTNDRTDAILNGQLW